MSVYGRILLAGLGSFLLLAAALAFQYLGDLQPCVLCIWQRWPHAIAVLLSIGAMTLFWRLRRPLSGLGAVLMTGGAALAAYHLGVEQGLWSGPGACSGGPAPADLSPEELLAQIEGAALVRCDEVAWDFFGISMAGWNAIVSIGLALLWLFAAIPRTPTPHGKRG